MTFPCNKFLISVIACLAMSVGAQAQSPTKARLADTDALMSRYTGDVPGASLLVVKDGKPIIRRGFGYANLEKREKAGPETDYRMASVTKQFTAASILLLKQDGKLRLADPIRKYLPELPESDGKITVYHLLTHTGGLIDYEDLVPADRKTQLNDDDVLSMIATQHKLYFEPGTAFRYSNGGYVLLGLIAQRVSGMDLADFMKLRIFKPLGMDHTLMYEAGRGPDVAHRAYGYSLTDGKWTQTDQSVTSATRGDGGIYTSIDDLAKWDEALYSDKLLSDESRKLAFTPHDPSGDPDTGYGFGWRLSDDTVWHSGESIGFRNIIVRWPQQHFSVIILTNRNEFMPYPLAITMGELLQLR
jgi:CubicO group peptidase (beta-lactamase class C family)